MGVNGQFRAPATLALGKETLATIKEGVGCIPDLVWMLWGSAKSLAHARDQGSCHGSLEVGP